MPLVPLQSLIIELVKLHWNLSILIFALNVCYYAHRICRKIIIHSRVKQCTEMVINSSILYHSQFISYERGMGIGDGFSTVNINFLVNAKKNWEKLTKLFSYNPIINILALKMETGARALDMLHIPTIIWH